MAGLPGSGAIGLLFARFMAWGSRPRARRAEPDDCATGWAGAAANTLMARALCRLARLCVLRRRDTPALGDGSHL